MRRAFASSVLSLLLLVTLVGGGCISCEQYFMFGGEKSCCAPDGHCKTKTPPTKQNPGRACAQIAFDHHKSIDHHIDLPIVDLAEMDALPSAIESVERWHGVTTVEPSPPDLQVLHSIFLI
ncbi:MAG: hypothetical protein WBY44_21500 [Bryobacteraceae bacterium]|jgi:hypothetical protein